MTDIGLPVKAEHTFEVLWRMFFFEGVVLVVLSLVALLLPPLASIAVAILFGWVLFAGGVVGLITTLAGRHAPDFWLSILSSLVAIAAGVLLFGWPGSGALSLTVILTVFLAADGILTIMLWLEYRRARHDRWMWLMVNGVIDLFLAALIHVGLPATAAWRLELLSADRR